MPSNLPTSGASPYPAPAAEPLSGSALPARSLAELSRAGAPAVPHPTLDRIAVALEQIAAQNSDAGKARRQAEITKELLSNSTLLAGNILKLKRKGDEAAQLLCAIAAPTTLTNLAHQSGGALGHLRKVISPVSNRLTMLSALLESCEEYSTRSEAIAASMADISTPQHTASELVEFGRSAVANFVKALGETHQVLELSREESEKAVGAIQKLKRLQAAYFSSETRQKSSIFDFIFNDPEVDAIEQKVPLYQGKPLISLALIDLAKALPSAKALEECRENESKLSVAMSSFHRTLALLKDPLLFTTLLADTAGQHLVAALDAVEALEKEVRALVKESKIEDAVAQAFNDGSRAFRDFFLAADAIRDGRSLGNDQTSSGGQFLKRHLRDGKLELTEFEPTTATPNHGSMQELYTELATMILTPRDKAKPLTRDRIEELVALRDAALKGGTTLLRVKRLLKDNERGNYCFELVGGDRELSLRQVPTSGVTLKQLHGSSWREVEKKVHRLLKHESRRVLYSDLSVRGKANNNMLVVGPYGMGKNLFARALGSEPQLVVIHGSTDRLLSKWLGEAEQNVRKVFEIAAETYDKYGKPVVLVLDEIDSFFPVNSSRGDGGAHHTILGMQKTLQTVLDGDVTYEGVSLVGLTNEPAGIPVPIYRRFGAVEIIRKFTPAERRDLLISTADQLPMAEGWQEKFPWAQFDRASDFASGDLLGKIYDEAFDYGLREVEKLGDPGLALGENVRAAVEKHGRLTPALRKSLWAESVPGIRISAEILSQIALGVLERPENQLAREQQERFYQVVDDRLGQAFSGDV